MGQKAVSDHSKEIRKRPSINDMEEEEKLGQQQEKEKKHMCLEFNMDNPTKSRNIHKLEETNTRNGLIVQHIPRSLHVQNLKINILSKLFGTAKQYKNSNYLLLFGIKIERNIDNINIFLVNSENYGVYHDREAVKSILDNACFKVKKKIVINEFYNYHTFPKLSEFSTFLTLPNGAFNCLDQFQEDIFCNPYANFNACLFNLERCRKSINQIIPKNEKNILLPSFTFNLEGKSLKSKNDFDYFIKMDKTQNEIDKEYDKYAYIVDGEERDFCDPECVTSYDKFFDSLNVRFSNICFELELKLEDCSDGTTIKKLNFIDYFFQQFQECFSRYKNVIISIQFINENFYKKSDEWKNFNPNNIYLSKFKEILRSLTEINMTLAIHYSYLEIHKPLNKLYNSYDSVYFDKEMVEQAYVIYFMLKKAHVFRKIRKKKPIIMNLINIIYGKSKIKTKRLNYDVEVVKNIKIVPFQMGQNNVQWLNTNT